MSATHGCVIIFSNELFSVDYVLNHGNDTYITVQKVSEVAENVKRTFRS